MVQRDVGAAGARCQRHQPAHRRFRSATVEEELAAAGLELAAQAGQCLQQQSADGIESEYTTLSGKAWATLGRDGGIRHRSAHGGLKTL